MPSRCIVGCIHQRTGGALCTSSTLKDLTEKGIVVLLVGPSSKSSALYSLKTLRLNDRGAKLSLQCDYDVQWMMTKVTKARWIRYGDGSIPAKKWVRDKRPAKDVCSFLGLSPGWCSSIQPYPAPRCQKGLAAGSTSLPGDPGACPLKP